MLIGKNVSSVHTEELLVGIAKTKLRDKMLLSLGVHVALVIVTSLPFIGLCLRYGSLDPRPLHEKARVDREQAESAAEVAAAAAAGEAAGATNAPPPTAVAGEDAAGADVAPGPAKSRIEQEIEAVSTDRPTQSTTAFDEIDSLE